MPSAVIPSVHSYAALRLAPQQLHQRYVHPGPLVLGTDPFNTPTPTADRDRTVSRRSEPSSRTTLIGEQPNPWDLLQPQDVMSRHRGAKPPRRYGLLGRSACYPRYLLSVERWPTHAGPPDHYGRLSTLLDVSVSQSSGLMPLHSHERFPTALEPTFARLRYSLGGDRPSQTACHARSRTLIRIAVRHPCLQGWYFKGGSTQAGARASKPTTYPTHADTNASAKLQ